MLGLLRLSGLGVKVSQITDPSVNSVIDAWLSLMPNCVVMKPRSLPLNGA